MFCLSRRANVVESFSYGKHFFQNFHAVNAVIRFVPFKGMANLPISGFAFPSI